jgi:hypothetical protein
MRDRRIGIYISALILAVAAGRAGAQMISGGTSVPGVRIVAYMSADRGKWEIWTRRIMERDGPLSDPVLASPTTDDWWDHPREITGYGWPQLVSDGVNVWMACLACMDTMDMCHPVVMKSTNQGRTWEFHEAFDAYVAIGAKLQAAYSPYDRKIHLTWEDCRSGEWCVRHHAVDP